MSRLLENQNERTPWACDRFIKLFNPKLLAPDPKPVHTVVFSKPGGSITPELPRLFFTGGSFGKSACLRADWGLDVAEDLDHCAVSFSILLGPGGGLRGSGSWIGS